MCQKQIGLGSISFIFLALGILWAFDINHFCVGDYILNVLGAKSWSSDNHLGNHVGILYSLIFFLPSCFIGYIWLDDLGAKISLKMSAIMSLILMGLAILFYL